MAVLTSKNERTIGGGHWYDREGNPRHTMLTAKGDRERRTTLRDARKHDLIPSVSGYLRLLEKESLQDWIQEQMIEAAATVPRHDNEPWEDWVARVKDAGNSKRDNAADLGTQIHADIEGVIKGEKRMDEVQYPLHTRPALELIEKKMLQVLESEVVVVNHRYGYAGTADIMAKGWDGRKWVLDFKTRKTKSGQAVRTYDEQVLQLAAYAASYFGEDAVAQHRVCAANIIISTTEEGRVEWVDHHPQDIRLAFDAFRHLCEVWRYIKGYDPRSPEWR